MSIRKTAATAAVVGALAFGAGTLLGTLASVGNPNDEPDWTYASCELFADSPDYMPPAFTYSTQCADQFGYIYQITHTDDGDLVLTEDFPPALPLDK